PSFLSLEPPSPRCFVSQRSRFPLSLLLSFFSIFALFRTMPATRARSTVPPVDTATFKNLDHPANNDPAIVGSRRAKQARMSSKARGKQPAARDDTVSEDDEIVPPSENGERDLAEDDPIEDFDEDRPPSFEVEFGNSPRYPEVIDHHPDGEGGDHDLLADIYFPAFETEEEAAAAADDDDLPADVRRTCITTMGHESRSERRAMENDSPTPGPPPVKRVSFEAWSRAAKRTTAAVKRAGLAVAGHFSPNLSPVAGPSGTSGGAEQVLTSSNG
ncbi:hypothetical protein CYLTODRAFT_22380, partial [Cylindrobasidium torrendii FP15055 ss-10]